MTMTTMTTKQAKTPISQSLEWMQSKPGRYYALDNYPLCNYLLGRTRKWTNY